MTTADFREKYKADLLRGHEAGEAGRFKEAESIYRKYIARCPRDGLVLFNLGVLVQRRADNPAERFEAADFYHRCINSQDDISIKSNAMNNLGLIMGKINHTEKAGICFGIALQMNPWNKAARINFADIFRHNGKYEEADREFAEVLRLDPESAAAKFSMGMIALLMGDLKRGYELYESRFDVDSFPTKRFPTDKLLWDGRFDLDDRTLLIWEEQGFGDTFMACRYFREIKRKWPECQIWFRGNMLYRRISTGMDGLDKFFALEDTLPTEYDFHCPIMSLPHRFGTTLETIPNEVPYIEDPRWSRYDIGGRWIEDKKKRIGLCWAGSPRHGKDHFRSIVPEEFQALIDSHPECKFYSLQVGPKANEVSRLKNVIDLAPTITDWTDSAQALLQLDLLVSVDTALVHLAGALDVPCFMACPLSPDWRWLLERETSPWYRKLRLFRQEKVGEWGNVLQRISDSL